MRPGLTERQHQISEFIASIDSNIAVSYEAYLQAEELYHRIDRDFKIRTKETRPALKQLFKEYRETVRKI